MYLEEELGLSAALKYNIPELCPLSPVDAVVGHCLSVRHAPDRLQGSSMISCTAQQQIQTAPNLVGNTQMSLAAT